MQVCTIYIQENVAVSSVPAGANLLTLNAHHCGFIQFGCMVKNRLHGDAATTRQETLRELSRRLAIREFADHKVSLVSLGTHPVPNPAHSLVPTPRRR
jgi:hypothetical protein